MDTSYINKVQKSIEYAREPERVTLHTLTMTYKGDNNTYTLSLSPDGWSCTCPGFQKYAICPHVMAIEKMFKPMLKRDQLPYAPGQNIVSDVKKAKRYSEEPERIQIHAFTATFRGDNRDHEVTYDDGKWMSTSSYFQSHGLGTYTMAMERILKGMVEPVMMPETTTGD